MKFTRKLPSENKDRSSKMQADGWKRLKEPPNIGMAILSSLPISVILMILTFLWLMRISTSLREQLQPNFRVTLQFDLFTILYFGMMLIFLLVHELIHAIFIPNFFRSQKTFWGMNGLFGFVYTEEPITKSRFMVISVMPLLILSFLLLLVMELLGFLNNFIMFLCILNAGGACVDILNLILISVQVHKGGSIVGNGNITLYKRKMRID